MECWLCEGLGAIAIHNDASVTFGRTMWVAHKPESKTHEIFICPVCKGEKNG